jgi:hypothetical protein
MFDSSPRPDLARSLGVDELLLYVRCHKLGCQTSESRSFGACHRYMDSERPSIGYVRGVIRPHRRLTCPSCRGRRSGVLRVTQCKLPSRRVGWDSYR